MGKTRQQPNRLPDGKFAPGPAQAEKTGEKQPASGAGRGPGRRFEPGQSGNPSGRPKGRRNAALVALEAVGDDRVDELIEHVWTLAMGGNTACLLALLERLWPRRPATVAVDVGPIASCRDIPAAAGRVVDATTAGKLSPGEGAQLLAMLRSRAAIPDRDRFADELRDMLDRREPDV